MTNTNQVLQEVAKERLRQMKKWGVQSHPDGTGPDTYPLDIGLEGNFKDYNAYDLAREFTDHTDDVFSGEDGTWTDILLEEVFEALAESDYDKLKAELIQVAAVAAAWVEDIDNREVGL